MTGRVTTEEELWTAVGEPTRRLLLDRLLAEGESTATRLAAGLPVTRQAVTKHLLVLDRAGLLESHRRGREVRYAVRPDQLQEGGAFYNYTRQNPSVTEREGLSVFAKDDEGTVFHTYSAYARGIDMVNVAYPYLDLVPKGRDEDEQKLFCVRRHDEY